MESLASKERTAWLQKQLRAFGSVTLAEAAEQLEVSEMTIRRDLQTLVTAGYARRVRGGAISTSPVSFAGRDRSRSEEKLAIARKLVRLVPRRGLIAFDSSSTMFRVATLVQSADDLMVLTNSVETLGALRDKPGIVPMLTGGRFDERSDSLVGPAAVRTAQSMTFDLFFASATSLHASAGAFESTEEEAAVKTALLGSSSRLVLGVDVAKLGRRAAFSSFPMDRISILSTELDPEDPRLSDFRSVPNTTFI